MAIANFGELTVMLPQFAGRYLPLEQSYLPRPMKIGYESDSYKFANKRAVDLEEGGGGRAQNDFRGSAAGRYGMRINVASAGAAGGTDEDVMSIRYRRRQQLEEEAWNRLKAENFDIATNQSPGSGGTCYTPGNSPWSRTVVASGITSPVAAAVAADAHAITRNNLTTAVAKAAAECLQSSLGPVMGDRSFKQEQQQQQAGRAVVLPKGVVLNEARQSMNPVATVARNQSTGEVRPVTANGTVTLDAENTQAAAIKGCSSAEAAPQRRQQSQMQKPDMDGTRKQAAATVKLTTKKPPLPRQASSDDTSLNEKFETIRTAHETRRANRTAALRDAVAEASAPNGTASSDESECENGPTPPISTAGRIRIICRSASDAKEPVVHQRSDPTPLSAAAQEALADAPTSALPIPIMHYPGDQLPAWLLRRRQRYQRSKTNPDLMVALAAMNGQQQQPVAHPLTSSSSSTQQAASASSSRVQQLLLERNCCRTGGPLLRQESDTGDLSAIAATCSSAAAAASHHDRRSRFRKRSSIVPDRESSCDGRLLQTPRFICAIDYMSKGKPRLVFGKKGSKEEELNWPRGIAVLGGNEFAVCDSSNHRVCIFNTGGRLLRMFGRYGTGDAQLDSAAGICCGRYKQLIVSDRYNHRIMIFDNNGQFLRKFGGHGPSSGRFNNPWGVAMDDMGLIYVVDKDNHRVQMFDSKGQFAGKFGTMGPGLGQFHHPQFIAIHKRTQNIYVTDSSNHRVCVFDHNGNPIFHFGTEGYQNGQMKFPRGIAVDDQVSAQHLTTLPFLHSTHLMHGFIIVADSGNNRVQIFYPDGRYMHSFGSWGNGPGQMKGVEAVALLDNTIVLSDRENHRIQLF
ncbi:unnamed protein product [Gongylonema pulchrum]|uniref:RING finger protein nhl-1 n=1 Tax=Gongylonema pulchrum TaxID=637853 RepID=A0A183E121_9BILA|nr:unnamed protein product [Gongylonema pulchrum]